MTSTAICIEGLGKRYRIGTAGNTSYFRYKSLRDSFGRLIRKPWTALARRSPVTDDNTFWALKDVSFEVKRGECVGIIGRNGAGKSTLLKILSRITKPTTGRVELHGRVGSLLEVGTGFHPELTGRENIYLNGAVLGMTRAEVKSRFDEIVAFSEIEKFLDTPVKQYSSGMYTRLAFAVAAHLEPEILVVDEVLAVGDAQFQKKCLGKMKDVAGEGRTVLFVSHNMGAVSNLCGQCAWLASGRMMTTGPSDSVIRSYLADGSANTSTVVFGQGPLRSCSVSVGASGFQLDAEYDTPYPIELPSLGFVVHNSHGVPVMGDNPRLSRTERPPMASSRGRVSAVVTSPAMRDGDYAISLWFGDSASDMEAYPDVLRMSITGQDGGSSCSPTQIGSVVPATTWRFSSNVQ